MSKRLRDVTPGELEEVGKFCAALLSIPDPWMSRRKESITVLDEAAIRRQQSVDFTIDAAAPFSHFKDTGERIFGVGVCVAPLFILEKKPAWSLAFDLEDETGRALPLMTSQENAEVSAATLKSLCKKKLQSVGLSGLPGTLSEKLELLATGDAAEGRAWHRRLCKPLPADPDHDEIAALLDESADQGQTAWWLRTLAYASIVLVTFESTPSSRRVLKLSYDEPMNANPRLPSRLGWRSFYTWVNSPFIGSDRYHFEIKAPPDFRLTRAALADDTGHKVTAVGYRRRAHLYIENARRSGGATVGFGLRVSGRGVIGGALAAALLVLLAVIACMAWSKNVAANSSGAPALLLVLPGLIATYVARADQHGLTTRLLAIPRWTLLLLAGCSAYYAAGRIALAGPAVGKDAIASQATAIRWWLLPSAVGALVAVLIIGVGWACARQTTHRILWRLSAMAKMLRKTGFRLYAEAPVSRDSVWRHIAEGIEPQLIAARRIRRATVTTDQDYRFVAGRYGRLFRWTHGVDVREGAEGTKVEWLFSAEGPSLLRPFIGLFVYEERRESLERLEAMRLAVSETS